MWIEVAKKSHLCKVVGLSLTDWVRSSIILGGLKVEKAEVFQASHPNAHGDVLDMFNQMDHTMQGLYFLTILGRPWYKWKLMDGLIKLVLVVEKIKVAK